MVVVAFLLASAARVSAQAPPAPQPDPLMQLMLTQPAIDITTNVEVRVSLDPPVIGVGEQATYRVTMNAVSDSIRWPADIFAPMELTVKQSARAQILQPAGAMLRPSTTINHHVTATKAGTFTIPEFKVKVYGRNVTVPAAHLEVRPSRDPAAPAPQRLYVELAETNAFCGQPVALRVLMPAGAGNALQVLNQVQINGDGILLDQMAVRQSIRQIEVQGRTGPAFIYESVLTPLVAGRLDLTAQAFTAGNQFSGAIVIQGQATIAGGPPQYLLLDSDAVRLEVEPLPRVGLLPGFTGAIGQFSLEPPELLAKAVRVGEVVKLFVTIRSEGSVKRIVAPPVPAVTNWQMFPGVPEALLNALAKPGTGNTVSFSYTMIPLTNSMTATPAIPFSYFDPQEKAYVDLTIPPVPIQITAGGATAEAQAIAQAAAATSGDKKLKLSGLARAPGSAAVSLVPWQLRSSFLWLQVGPLLAFAGLWYWDRRRRFLEQHPEIVVRRRARQALRRERKVLLATGRAGDAARFARAAVNALRVVSAPHFPAAPRALVGRDVLELLDEPAREGRAGDVVREIFSVTDATQFSPTPSAVGELLRLQTELNQVLDKLEAKL